ncbi:MAG: RNA-binding protein [Lachnospiraceae bacterium]
MGKEEDMLKKRLIELSNQAYSRGFVTFSDFLNLNELNILHTIPKYMFPAGYETYGGYELSERQMAAFLPDALCFSYPVKAVRVTPLNKRFAEELTHRDYLGSLMNLGIDRCRLGDILADEGGAVVFAKEEIAGYIAESLTRVRHTSVKASVQETSDITYTPRYESIKGTVPSVRLDTVLSVCFPLSRSRLVPLIEGGKVFVNGKLITSNGYHLKEGDIISVRGTGKAVYDGILSETKKGRYLISVRKYM